MPAFSIPEAVNECKKAAAIRTIPEEYITRIIAKAPQMFGFICILLQEDMLNDSPKKGHGFKALTRARNIVEDITSNRIKWLEDGEEEIDT